MLVNLQRFTEYDQARRYLSLLGHVIANQSDTVAPRAKRLHRHTRCSVVGSEVFLYQRRLSAGHPPVKRTGAKTLALHIISGQKEQQTAVVKHVQVGQVWAQVVEPRPPLATRLFNVEQAREIAVRTHPSIEEAQHSVAAAELNIRRAEAAVRPSVTLGGQVAINQDGDTSRGATLSIGGPIYQGGRIASVIRQAQAQRDAARAGLLLSVQQVNQNVGNAYSSLLVARARSAASDQQVRAAFVAFRGVREEATLGARTTLDVLDAEQELLDARASLISAQIDETLASYSVLSAMGLLTARDLGLRVQVYDPEAYYDLVREAPTSTSQQGQALDRVLEAIGRD